MNNGLFFFRMDNSKFKVLIVDDSSLNVVLLQKILETERYTIVTAGSGSEALRIVDREKIDLVLLDIMMPGMDGYAVCRQLQKNELSCDIPVIFITARTDINDIVQGFETGAVDYISRPFNPAELLARVKTHIELRFSKQIIQRQVVSLKETNRRLLDANQKLMAAMDEIQTLKGLFSVCSNCRRIRKPEAPPDLQSSWIQLEAYLAEHTTAKVTHTLCPICFAGLYPDFQSRKKTKLETDDLK